MMVPSQYKPSATVVTLIAAAGHTHAASRRTPRRTGRDRAGATAGPDHDASGSSDGGGAGTDAAAAPIDGGAGGGTSSAALAAGGGSGGDGRDGAAGGGGEAGGAGGSEVGGVGRGGVTGDGTRVAIDTGATGAGGGSAASGVPQMAQRTWPPRFGLPHSGQSRAAPRSPSRLSCSSTTLTLEWQRALARATSLAARRSATGRFARACQAS
jgi:hypothetical protein